MSATTQRLMLSFIYVHREHIPLSALKDFVDALFTAVSILPTSGWIRMLLEMLVTFCSARVIICSDKRYSRERFDMSTRHEIQNDGSLVHHKNADNEPSDCSSLNDIIQHHGNDSSLWGQYCENSGFNDRQTELAKEGNIIEINAEMSVEFCDTAIIAATQHERTDDSVNVLYEQHSGIVMFNIVLTTLYVILYNLFLRIMSVHYFCMILYLNAYPIFSSSFLRPR